MMVDSIVQVHEQTFLCCLLAPYQDLVYFNSRMLTQTILEYQGTDLGGTMRVRGPYRNSPGDEEPYHTR